jgi:membrane protein DedA with SNARE-associated domain
VVIGAKAVDIAAVPTFLAAGLAGIPYRRFVGWVASASAIRAAVLLALGVLFGREAADLLKSPGTAIALALGLAVCVGGVHLLVRRWAGRRFRLTTV